MMPSLDALRKRFSQVVDSQGKHIDAEILEMVVVLNACGFETMQSCGGHLTELRGLVTPWVAIDPIDGVLLRQDERLGNALMQAYEARDPVWNEYAAQRLAVQKEIRKVQGRMCRDLAHHLNSFYADRLVAFDRRLILQCGTYIRLHNQGAMFWLEAEHDIQEVKLQEYRAEMVAFTDFLNAMVEGD